MTDLFLPAVDIVVSKVEGVSSNDPKDPGGLTKWGIASRYYASVLDPHFAYADALAIYRKDFWDKHSCGLMPWRWALGVFDGAVNPADNNPVQLAQLALRVTADGAAGIETIRAMGAASLDTYQLFLALRGVAYSKVAGFSRYGDGWLKRLFIIYGAAVAA